MTETAADEQDLAKALDSVVSAASSAPTPTSPQDDSDIDLKFETTANGGAVTSPYGTSAAAAAPSVLPLPDPIPVPVQPQQPVASTDNPVVDNTTDAEAPLETIKKDALVELRPLVDKLNVSAEEKFDTYLLLIRSTDDADLIGPAHEAAKAIQDETRRAEALLDIIKEIDYLSKPKQD